MFLKLILLLVVLIAAVLIFAAAKPNTLRIQRSITIQAPPEKVFALINDFHNWPLWAPQDKEDPAMQRTYSGSQSGQGAISDWHGKGSTGNGRMTITESVPSSRIVVTTDFVKPFEAHNINQFTLEPAGDSTKLTWTMQGTNVYMMKVMSVFTSMDSLMGSHFEKGLANLSGQARQ